MCFAVQLSMCSLLLFFATALIEYQLVPGMSSTFFIFFEIFFYFSGRRFRPSKACISVLPGHYIWYRTVICANIPFPVSDRDLCKFPVSGIGP